MALAAPIMPCTVVAIDFGNRSRHNVVIFVIHAIWHSASSVSNEIATPEPRSDGTIDRVNIQAAAGIMTAKRAPTVPRKGTSALESHPPAKEPTSAPTYSTH